MPPPRRPAAPSLAARPGKGTSVSEMRGMAAKIGVGLFALLLGAAEAVAQGAPSFKGKTITMIVGSEAGGGTDASGRLIAPYLRKYLPGEPNIVVHNMPGASDEPSCWFHWRPVALV